MERYDLLFLPVLRLLVCIMTSLPKNEDVSGQILDFIDAHSELFSTVLKDRSPVVTLGSLTALSLTTALFYNLSYHEHLIYTKVNLPMH